MRTAKDHRVAGRVFAAFGAVVAVLALAVLLFAASGCAPSVEDGSAEGAGAASGQDSEGADGAQGQAFEWRADSDCTVCHVEEAATMASVGCAQAPQAEGALACTSCHALADALAEVHAGVTYDDAPAAKATVDSVDQTACMDCHGNLEEVALLTSGSTALTDSNGTTVNPHERPAGERHAEMPATCTDCHNVHSDTLSKDAMKYCAQCHHRGIFQCGTCHEVRE